MLIRTFLATILSISPLQLRAADLIILRGRLFLPPDQPDKPIEIVLKQGKHVVSRSSPDEKRDYEFANLANGRYELVIKAGKQTRVEVNLCCNPNTVAVVDVNLDRSSPTIAVNFPLEPPDVVDIQELKHDYPEGILKEYEKARGDIRSRKFDRAAERLKYVVRNAADFYSARALLGMVFHASGCLLDAEGEYVRACELNPKSIQAMMNLGSLYIEAAGARLVDDRPYLDEAISILEKAMVLRPTSSLLYCLLGSAYFKKELYEEAEENLSKALERVKSPAAARLMLANVYMKQKRWAEAIEQIDVYLRENPFSPDRGKIKDVRKEIASYIKTSSNSFRHGVEIIKRIRYAIVNNHANPIGEFFGYMGR